MRGWLPRKGRGGASTTRLFLANVALACAVFGFWKWIYWNDQAAQTVVASAERDYLRAKQDLKLANHRLRPHEAASEIARYVPLTPPERQRILDARPPLHPPPADWEPPTGDQLEASAVTAPRLHLPPALTSRPTGTPTRATRAPTPATPAPTPLAKPTALPPALPPALPEARLAAAPPARPAPAVVPLAAQHGSGGPWLLVGLVGLAEPNSLTDLAAQLPGNPYDPFNDIKVLLLPHSVKEQQAAERILSKQPNKAANFVIEQASATADVARLLQLASVMHPQYMLIVQRGYSVCPLTLEAAAYVIPKATRINPTWLSVGASHGVAGMIIKGNAIQSFGKYLQELGPADLDQPLKDFVTKQGGAELNYRFNMLRYGSQPCFKEAALTADVVFDCAQGDMSPCKGAPTSELLDFSASCKTGAF